MSAAWQYVVVAIVVLAAAVFLGRRIWQRLTPAEKSAGCGAGCGTCSQPSATSDNVIPLESLTSSLDRLNPPRN